MAKQKTDSHTKAWKERTRRHQAHAMAREDEARRRSHRAVSGMPTSSRSVSLTDIRDSAQKTWSVRVPLTEEQKGIWRRYQRQVLGYTADRGLAIGGLLGILFVLLLTANIIGHFIGTPDRTVMGLLTSMQSSTMPQISLDWLDWTAANIVGDWGIFEFLRVFLNGFVDLINTIAFIGTSLINAVVWVLWFVKWVLFGV